MPLIAAALAWMLGLLLADAFRPPLWPTLYAAGGATVLAWRLSQRPRQVLTLLACAAWAAVRLLLDTAPLPPDHVARHGVRDALQLRGVVVEDPQPRAGEQRLVLAVQRLRADGRHAASHGLVLVRAPRYPEYRYGDLLDVAGETLLPRSAERPGGFDYRSYLARKHIHLLMTAHETRLVARDRGQPLLGGLRLLREHARRRLIRLLPEPQAALAVGMLLGITTGIPADVERDFSDTGTSHIVVISGWNITIIASGLAALAPYLRLDRRGTFGLTLAVIWLYTTFVGLGATVVRAAVMGSIVVIGRYLDRPGAVWTTLFAACWAMTLWQPQTLWDMGFQLSALATASLLMFGAPVDALLGRTPLAWRGLGWAREALAATLAAQWLALPLILYHFGTLSVIAPLANVAILPAVPLAMLFGALALAAALVWLPLGQLLAWPAYLCFAWQTEAARLLAGVPWAARQVPPVPLWSLLAGYALIIAVGVWLMWRAARQTERGHAELRPAET
jgi:competence protein ComEC